MKRLRDKQKGVTEGVTKQGVTEGSNGVEMFEGKPRYLTLSDGQVFDRTYQPNPNKHIPEMVACNRANDIDLSKGRRAKRLALIYRALDKETTGLDGKRVNLTSMIRIGVSGPTFEEVLR